MLLKRERGRIIYEKLEFRNWDNFFRYVGNFLNVMRLWLLSGKVMRGYLYCRFYFFFRSFLIIRYKSSS